MEHGHVESTGADYTAIVMKPMERNEKGGITSRP